LTVEIIFIIQKCNKKYKTNIFIKTGLWILFLLLNLIGNILGKTLFEKIFMGGICVIQIVNIIIMIFENKKYIK
jgi:antibiotic biosynthesis monooxygenase (ABM) superfamily enzyme